MPCPPVHPVPDPPGHEIPTLMSREIRMTKVLKVLMCGIDAKSDLVSMSHIARCDFTSYV